MKPVQPMITLFSLLAAVTTGLASSENVTIGPSNLNETVKFYSKTAGELHSMSVVPESGYKFKSGPDLQLNPEDLWGKVGSDSFQLSDMEDRTEIEAEVAGILVPDGSGGGGGPPPEYPIEITMITRYFTMEFILPTNEDEFIKDESLAVALSLSNAIGSPSHLGLCYSFQTWEVLG